MARLVAVRETGHASSEARLFATLFISEVASSFNTRGYIPIAQVGSHKRHATAVVESEQHALMTLAGVSEDHLF